MIRKLFYFDLSGKIFDQKFRYTLRQYEVEALKVKTEAIQKLPLLHFCLCIAYMPRLCLISEVESRTQGSRPRPRTQKKSEAKAKDTKKIRGQGQGQPFRGQTLSRPRPRTKDTERKCSPKKKRSSQKFFRRSPKKKKVFTKIFQAISTKKRFPKNFTSAPQNFNIPKNRAVLEPRTGQFSRTWGLEAKAKDFKMCPRGRPRGQGRPRGLHLCLIFYRFYNLAYWKPFNFSRFQVGRVVTRSSQER